MTTQLMIYETAVPVSSGRHGKASVEVGKGFAFARKINSVPLMAVEFALAAPEYAIVFAENGEDVMPVVILGARQNENLYLKEDDGWRADYLPAFIRRYPFVFSPGADGKTFTLCVDESFQGLNYLGRGQALFTGDGKPTAYVDDVLKFLQEYRVQFVRTQAFCRKLKDLKLLEPTRAQFTLGSGEKMSLSGFLAIERQRLKELPGDTLSQLAATDELELIYLHLQSMRNFNEVKERLNSVATAKGAEAPSAEAPPAEAPSAEPATPGAPPPKDEGAASTKARRAGAGRAAAATT